jgi:hypothetical protein
MNRFAAAAAFATGALVSTSAFAIAQRTFVSTTGSDAAACSLAAPCRSFGAALAQTATGGEIVVLDSGGYGAVAISKAVSIIAPRGVYGGITAFPTSPNATGITVFDARVVLRGLSINGQGGDFGIWVFGDAVVHIEDCTISNLDQYGVRISGLIGSPEVFIAGSVIRDNASHGVHANGDARVHVDRSWIRRNGGDGIRALNGPNVTVTSSELAANSGDGAIARTDDGASITTLVVTDSTAARNGANGIHATASNTGPDNSVRLHAARNTVASNVDGIVASGSLDSSGLTHATVADNLVTDNANAGITVAGYARLLASNNTVTFNFYGLVQLGTNGVMWTRGNNTVRSTLANNVLGTLTPITSY